MFNIIDHVICDDVTMTYFPGDDIQAALLQPEEYKKLCGKRLTKVKKFIKSDEHISAIVKSCISSIPRWRFARELQADPKEKTRCADDGGESDDSDDDRFEYISVDKDLRGIARAQGGFLDDARRILKGKHSLAEFVINREPDHTTIRLEVWRSIAASALYLSEKNMPFTSDVYRVIRGEYSPVHFLSSIDGMPRCCSESGAEEKIYRILSKLPRDETRVAAELRIALVLGSVSIINTGKRGSDNGYLEGLFSICRMLGLKLGMFGIPPH